MAGAYQPETSKYYDMHARKALRAPPLRSPPNDSRSDSTRDRVKTAPRLYGMKCGDEAYGHFGSGGGLANLSTASSMA